MWVAFALTVLTLAGSAARATTIQVNTNAMTINATDGKCTLAEAVQAVNTQTASGSAPGECLAGNGTLDTINLMSTAQTYSTFSDLVLQRTVHVAGAGVTKSTLKTGALHGFLITDPLHVHAQPGTFIVQNQNPRLGPLMDTGTPGATKVHALLSGSPAINRLTTPDDPTDQRYMWRPEPQTIPGGGITQGTSPDIGAYEFNNVWPYNTLVVAASSGDPIDSTGQFFTYAANAVGDFITVKLLVAEAGTYAFTAQVQRFNQGGIYRLQTADALAGPYTNRGSQDLFAVNTTTPELSFGSATFTSTGVKFIRLMVTGKDLASGGYRLFYAYIKAVKTS